MKNIYKLLAVVLLASLLLCSCGNNETDLDYNSLVVAPVDVNITDCITDAQVSTVMGYPMTLLGVYEDGTQAIYMSEDGTCQVTINLKNESRALFDSNAAQQQTTLQEGLGETAYWSVETGELVVYANSYALGVSVIMPEDVTTETYTRQIAEMMLKKLYPAE